MNNLKHQLTALALLAATLLAPAGQAQQIDAVKQVKRADQGQALGRLLSGGAAGHAFSDRIVFALSDLGARSSERTLRTNVPQAWTARDSAPPRRPAAAGSMAERASALDRDLGQPVTLALLLAGIVMLGAAASFQRQHARQHG